MFHTHRLETISVLPHQYWYCFKGNIGETGKTANISPSQVENNLFYNTNTGTAFKGNIEETGRAANVSPSHVSRLMFHPHRLETICFTIPALVLF